MSHTGYIVANTILSEIPRGVEWHATGIPADPTKSLVVINWDNPNHERDFETRVDILPLGRPWEPLPAEAGPLLASFNPTPVLQGPLVGAAPLPDVPMAPDTVSTALRKMEWPMARLVR